MSITTYTELKAAVASWLARDDLTANIPDFITLFEAVANRRLRVRQMETTATLVPSGGSVALPTDYVAYRRVTWTGSPRRELEYVNPSWMQRNYPDAPTGPPNVFTIEGANLEVRPEPTTDSIEFAYYQKIPALATTDPNWLLAAHPDLYLFGALTEAQGFTVDFDKLSAWKSRRDELFEEITELANKSKGIGGIRIMSSTP